MSNVWTRNRQRVGDAIDEGALRVFGTLIAFLKEVGRTFIFFYESVGLVFTRPFRFGEIIHHMEFVGNKSVLIICMTSVFTGLAMAFQIYLGFSLVNATNLVGPTVGLGIARELGPVLTGLIVSARAGGAMAARLGTMRVSEQIDALAVMGVDPRQYLVAPRIIAAFIMMPLLCAVFDFVAMMGAYSLCIHVLKLDQAIFWDKIQLWLNPGDIYQGLMKAAIFGVSFATICTYRGYNAEGGAKGVGDATNEGVVNSMVMVIVLNYFATNFIRSFYLTLGWK